MDRNRLLISLLLLHRHLLEVLTYSAKRSVT